ncbi:MAG: hypothetical protein K2X60_04525 [Xanthobacteraceae bacterium]|nr:hypothetical protein [Xanthobacteraceae bacterium]
MFTVNGIDTSGTIALKRQDQAAALKKARELTDDGCWDVSITSPDGRLYPLLEFERLAALLPSVT